MPDERELRIAPVMTGGTSLAVWMGGATYELYRVARARTDEPGTVYGRLLELTETVPVIDVITGTSAGGLNGTLLAAATHLGVDTEAFRRTRDTWLDVADIQRLLRKPSEADPPALLKGDDYFAVQVEEKLRDWANEFGPAAPGVDGDDTERVDLVTTVTTIAPDPLSRSDDFGEQLSEVRHAHLLRFVSSQLRAPGWIEKLAVASRTSASIPGVFEPSFLPIGAEDAATSGRPDFDGHATFLTSRWAVDGGVVVNLPLGEALERIFQRSASGEVRRVVLYVSPTPSSVKASKADVFKDEPTLLSSLLTVALAPRAEGVATDIDTLTAHNRRVHRQASARRASSLLVQQIDLVGGQGVFTDQLFESYRRVRAETSVSRTLNLLEDTTEIRIAHRRREIETLLRTERAPLITDRWGFGRDVPGGPVPWSWGIEPVEQAVSQAVSLINRTLALPSAADDDDCRLWRAQLAAHKTAVHTVRARVARVRSADRGYWNGAAQERAQADASQFEPAALQAWAASAYAQWPGAAMDRGTAFAELLGCHRGIAEVLIAAFDPIAGLTAREDTADPVDVGEERAAIVEELSALLSAGTQLVLAGNGALDDAARQDAWVVGVQRALLAVHVAQTVFVGDIISNEQPAELMQLSFNSWNGLDERRRPHEKLAGPELGRLGAFVKRSWRANDWFWGRMDAAYRLVLLLLEPGRIRRLGKVPALEELLAGEAGLTDPAALPAEVRDELDALSDPTVATPASLPASARFLARVVQQRIAQQELPLVADDIERSGRDGGNEAESLPFQRAYAKAASDPAGVAADATTELVQLLRIGTETVRSEFGYGLMNRVSTGLVSVLINAATGKRAGLPVVSRILRPLRAPLQAIASLIRVLSRDSRLSQALMSAVLAITGAIVALAIAGQDVPPGTLVISAALLTLVVVLAMLRSGFLWLGAVAALAAGTITLTLVGGDLAEVVDHDPEASAEGAEGAAAPAEPIAAGSTLRFDDGGRIRVDTEEPGELFQDVELPAGGTVEIIEGDGDVDVPVVERGEQEWKAWGFTNHVSVARFVLALLALAGLVVAVAEWRTSSPGTRLSRLGWVGLAVAAAFAVRTAGTVVLTSDHDHRDAVDPIKEWLVGRAQDLHDFKLEVVLGILVGAGVALSVGADLTASRRVRTARRRILEVFRLGGRELHAEVQSTGAQT